LSDCHEHPQPVIDRHDDPQTPITCIDAAGAAGTSRLGVNRRALLCEIRQMSTG
jgi:hypothetical protein